MEPRSIFEDLLLLKLIFKIFLSKNQEWSPTSIEMSSLLHCAASYIRFSNLFSLYRCTHMGWDGIHIYGREGSLELMNQSANPSINPWELPKTLPEAQRTQDNESKTWIISKKLKRMQIVILLAHHHPNATTVSSQWSNNIYCRPHDYSSQAHQLQYSVQLLYHHLADPLGDL